MKSRMIFAIFSLIAMFNLVSGFFTLRAATEEGPAEIAIWHLSLTIEQQTEGKAEARPDPLPGGKAIVFESLAPMNIEADISQNIEIIKDSLKVSYNWKYEQKHWFGNSLAYSCQGNESGNKLVDWSLQLKRHIKTAAGEPVDVYDYDQSELELKEIFSNFTPDQPANTFRLDYNLVIPAKSTRTDYFNNSGPEQFEMLQSFQDYFTGPYQYNQPVNQESNRSLIPPNIPTFGIEVRHRISYRLTTKNLTLEYLPLTIDMINHPSVQKNKTTRRQRDEPFLAKGGDNNEPGGSNGYYFLHGNSMIIPKVNGVDRSGNFSTIRLLRDWEANIDNNGDLIGTYQAPDNIWRNDYDAVSPKPSWVDTPGYSIPGSAGQWEQKRFLQEYLVAVNGFPEFGFLYFIVVVDTKPGLYRVRMYDALGITAEQWKQIKESSQPYQNEKSAVRHVDSGWRGPWGE